MLPLRLVNTTLYNIWDTSIHRLCLMEIFLQIIHVPGLGQWSLFHILWIVSPSASYYGNSIGSFPIGASLRELWFFIYPTALRRTRSPTTNSLGLIFLLHPQASFN